MDLRQKKHLDPPRVSPLSRAALPGARDPVWGPPGWGRSSSCWQALAPEDRLRLGSVVGNRTGYSARRLCQRIRRALDGSVPLLTSDQRSHDAEVLLDTFGIWEQPPRTGRPGRPKAPRRVPPPDLGDAQVVHPHRQGRVVAVTRPVIFGHPAQVATRASALRRANGRN